MPETHPRQQDRASPEQRAQQLARELADITFALPGTITTRHVRCGKASCRCNDDPPQLHGPYIQWTRTENGKTVSKLLTQEQFTRYQPWFDNHRRLRELIHELETLSIQAIHHTEDW